MKKTLIAAIQICFLAALSQLGYLCAGRFNLPLPGNLVGLLLLLALLSSGIVRLAWIDSGASVLLKHLAFFFVPIAVGLMSFGDLLQRHGLALIATLLIAAAIGIVSAGFVTQALGRHSRVEPKPGGE